MIYDNISVLLKKRIFPHSFHFYCFHRNKGLYKNEPTVSENVPGAKKYIKFRNCFGIRGFNITCVSQYHVYHI